MLNPVHLTQADLGKKIVFLESEVTDDSPMSAVTLGVIEGFWHDDSLVKIKTVATGNTRWLHNPSTYVFDVRD